MISEIDFLLVEHESCSFLINKEQVTASLVPGKVGDVASNLTYVAGFIRFKHEKVLLFDLEGSLHQVFHLESRSCSHLCLVSKIESFSPVSKKLFALLARGKTGRNFSPEYVAFKVQSGASIKRVSFNSLKLIPSCVRKAQEKAGILALCFEEEPNKGNSKIKYLIDIEKILFNRLLTKING